MVKATSRKTKLRRALRISGLTLLVLSGIVIATDFVRLRGQENAEGGNDGMFITVPSTVPAVAVDRMRKKITNAVGRGRTIGTIVFDFNANGQPLEINDFDDCNRLRKFIESINRNNAAGVPKNITTIAYVPGDVSRHAVLPVLACSQVVMSGKAHLGPIREAGTVLSAEEQKRYEELAETKGLLGVIRKLLDGERLSAAEARKQNLCKEIYESKRQLAFALGLPPESLREDWLAGRVRTPCKVELNGEATPGNLQSFSRRVKKMIQEGHNFIILWLNSEGGNDLAAAADVQIYLASRKKTRNGSPIRTIAYVPSRRNLGAATFVALGASEIVMGSKSVLADFSYLERPNTVAAKTIGELAEKQGYPGTLFRAALDPNLVVYRAHANGTRGVVGFLSKEDWEKDQDLIQPRWSKNKSRLIRDGKDFPRITAGRAKEAGIAAFIEVDSFEDLCRHYEITEMGTVPVSSGDWLDGIAEFFRQPVVKILLLLIGITGLILEIKMPGFGLPGITAAICFVLFFWSHSYHAQYPVLSVLLFLLGLILLGIEIFVIPGFGVCGFSGLALLIISLLLVTLSKMPDSPEEWQSLGWTLSSFLLSLIGAIVAAIAIGSFLPHVPYANRLMLTPPDDSPDSEHLDVTAADTEAYAALLGAIGITETPLRPAGKVRFGNDYVDVISQGDYISPGSRVQVVEIEASRIVVKQV